MKKNSLNILKTTIVGLLGFAFCVSCAEDTEVSKTQPSLPDGASEVPVKLLIKGEAIVPPSTRSAMDPETEQSFKDSLQLLILAQKEDNATDKVYYYNTHRPVLDGSASGTSGGAEGKVFSVKVPTSLNNRKLKFLLFSNSKGILGENPDDKFIANTTTEEQIRTALTLTVKDRWEHTRKIPMWAEDELTFTVPTATTTPEVVANLKLMRMLARVDVGVKYDGYQLSSTAGGLTNFKLKKVKVAQSKDKGQLMPDASAYTTSGSGASKEIKITAPSIPTGGAEIPRDKYTNDVAEGSHSYEREIYLFEQQITKSDAGEDKKFDVNRTCILIQGEYTSGGVATTGWYRLDFSGFRKSAAEEKGGYMNIMRNMLYRFNITAVNGSGFATEEDALNSPSSNITVDLIPMELHQNDIIFDGQSYLSVNKSELFFYKSAEASTASPEAAKSTASLSLETDHPKGWRIEGLEGGISASPASGGKGSAVTELSWSPLPTTATDKEIYLRAGNLKKKITLKYLNKEAPGDLQSFSLSPSILYFLKQGGLGTVNVQSNITEKSLSKITGKLNFTLPTSTTSETFNVTVEDFPDGGSTQSVENGAAVVNVKAANADITGQVSIRQLTYDKEVTCTPAMMPHGFTGQTAELTIPYATKEEAGTYLIFFLEKGNGISVKDPWVSTPGGTVTITARQNKSSIAMPVGELRFDAALGGEPITLQGYTPKVVPIMQEAAPKPEIRIETSATDPTDLPWSGQAHSFTVKANDNELLPEGKPMAIQQVERTITDLPSEGTVDAPVSFTLPANRGDNAKSRTVRVTVDGHGDYKVVKDVVYRQQAPDSPAEGPTPRDPASSDPITIEAKATSFTLQLGSLSNIYEIQVLKKSDPIRPGEKIITIVNSPQNDRFTINGDKGTAVFQVAENGDQTPRTLKVETKVFGNRESQFFTRNFHITQKGRGIPGSLSASLRPGTNITPDAATYTNAITVAHVNMQDVTVRSNVGWISPTYVQNSTVATFTLGKNGYTTRTGTITFQGTDLAGESKTAEVTITQPPYTQGTITMTPKRDEAKYRENAWKHADNSADSYVDFSFANIVSDFTARPLSNWIATYAVTGTGNARKIAYRVIEDNNTGKKRTGKISVEGRDPSGALIKAEVEIYQNYKPYIQLTGLDTGGFSFKFFSNNLNDKKEYQITYEGGQDKNLKVSVSEHSGNIRIETKQHTGGLFPDMSGGTNLGDPSRFNGKLRVSQNAPLGSTFYLYFHYKDFNGVSRSYQSRQFSVTR